MKFSVYEKHSMYEIPYRTSIHGCLYMKHFYTEHFLYNFHILHAQLYFCSYEKSDTHHFEVPRMLLDDPDELQEYIMKSKDKCVLCDNVPHPRYPNVGITQDTVSVVGRVHGELRGP